MELENKNLVGKSSDEKDEHIFECHSKIRELKRFGIIDEILKEQDYDPMLLNDFGGGNVSWWHNYICYEVGRCNEYWRSILESYSQLYEKFRSKSSE